MIKLLSGDCRDVLPTLPAESVQCVVTSPPYYGLRDYGTALWDGGDAACSHDKAHSMSTSGLEGGKTTTLHAHYYRDTCGKCGAVRVDRQIGLEATPDLYLQTMVQVFREVRRVLRRDGTCWVNMGDSYAGSPTSSAARPAAFAANGTPMRGADRNGMGAIVGAKPKDLLLMPARLALALQQDGWWVRSDIIWHKPNPMPESVTDRPTSAHEHVFLITKSARYFYDADAVREAQTSPDNRDDPASRSGVSRPEYEAIRPGGDLTRERIPMRNRMWNSAGRSCRNVWTIATHAYPNAHFATFPPELAERCIKAGTSERGCCPQCGAPWYRVTERTEPSYWEQRKDHDFAGRKTENAPSDNFKSISRGRADNSGVGYANNRTTGWRPSCECDGYPDFCTVLDPFAGAGTTLLVADRLQRHAIGIELNTAYTEMAMERCRADAPLFTAFPPAEDPEEIRMADLFTDMAAG